MYINTETNQYPVTEAQIRAENPNTSFPKPFKSPEKYVLVFPTPKPTFDTVIQYAREVEPEYTDKNVWEQRWEVVSRFVEYTDADGVLHTVQEQEEAAILADQQEKAIRLKETVITSTQERLDDFAKTRNYDGILSACTYATSTVQKFQQEGQYCVEARDATWNKLYEILAEVEAGTRPLPESYTDIEPELPVLEWAN